MHCRSLIDQQMLQRTDCHQHTSLNTLEKDHTDQALLQLTVPITSTLKEDIRREAIQISTASIHMQREDILSHHIVLEIHG